MILDRFIKIYRISSKLSSYHILREIEDRAKKQSKNLFQLATDSINYRQFKLIDNTIEIERNPAFFNPFKGSGNITLELISTNSGTEIECRIVPSLLSMIINFALLLIILISATILMFTTMQNVYFETIIFMIVFWTGPLIVFYFVCKLNTTNLDSYTRLILYDLKILHPSN